MYSGFTRLCKGLAVVLVGTHVAVQVVPSLITYLALIPARTIPFVWNLITSGYIEQSIYGVFVSVIGLLFLGRVLQPIWGSREFFNFIIFVNFLTSVCVFVAAIALYYVTWDEIYLYIPFSGFHGVLSGFLVGVKQILPDQDISPSSALSLKAKWLPSLLLLLSFSSSFLIPASAVYLPTLLFGTYTSWVYLRFIQKKPESKIRGDGSDEFRFSTFFPEVFRPVVDRISSVFGWVFCRRRFGVITGGEPHQSTASPLPGSDPIDASRRRERGARALEERLMVENLSASNDGAAARKDPDDNV